MTCQPRQIYQLLLETCQAEMTKTGIKTIQDLLIGLTWTICRLSSNPLQSLNHPPIGLCMSPGRPTRTLPWSGTLAGRAIADVIPWINTWDDYQAAIAMAVINAVLNCESPLLASAQTLSPQGSANLAVFEHFLPQITGKRVIVIGRYPGLAQYEPLAHCTVLERQPTAQDLPDTACEYLLPEADWVFLTATSIANKTFPRLVELSQDATVVLMGPTVPWLPQLAEMGINYLAGIKITNPDALYQTIAEGGGTRIFNTGVTYAVTRLI